MLGKDGKTSLAPLPVGDDHEQAGGRAQIVQDWRLSMASRLAGAGKLRRRISPW